jgi:hypothetical protein
LVINLHEERGGMNWDLNAAERELLRRDCEASKVPIAVLLLVVVVCGTAITAIPGYQKTC